MCNLFSTEQKYVYIYMCVEMINAVKYLKLKLVELGKVYREVLCTILFHEVFRSNIFKIQYLSFFAKLNKHEQFLGNYHESF